MLFVCTLPLIFPPVALGYLLLLVFGINAPLGHFLYETFGIRIVFSEAAVMLSAFIAGLPLVIRPIKIAFESKTLLCLEEAARVCGASPLRTFVTVTLPTIRPVVLSSVWIAIMNNFQMYTIINLMTGGGPSEATYTLSIAAYEKAFTDYNFGQGAAIGVMWLVFLTVVTVIINKLSAKSAENL